MCPWEIVRTKIYPIRFQQHNMCNNQLSVDQKLSFFMRNLCHMQITVVLSSGEQPA